MKILIKILFLMLLVSNVNAVNLSKEVQIGGYINDFEMDGLLNSKRKLSFYYGKPLIINIWASWCGPCLEEINSLEILNRTYGGNKFNLIGVSTDDYRDRAEMFVKKNNLTFNNYIDHNVILENMFGASHLPTTIFIDSKGIVIYKTTGYRQWNNQESIKMIEDKLKIKIK